MISLVIFLTCIFIAVAIAVLAAWSDFKGMIIPNWHSASVVVSFLAAFVLMHLLGHGDVFQSAFAHLAGGVVVFLVTAALFALRVMGAGDSKLLTAFAFWAGVSGMPAFLFYTTMVGGLLGVATLILRKYKPLKAVPAGSWIEKAQSGENKVPYGIAIACGALASFVQLGYFSNAIMTLLG